VIAVPVEAWVGLTLASSVVFGVTAPAASRVLPPRSAVWLLSAGSLLLAGSAAVVLGLVVVSVAGGLAPIAMVGHWSAQRVAASEPFDPTTALVAGALLGVGAMRAGVVSWSTVRPILAAWSASRACPVPLVVLPDREPMAFAVPGWPGRIVASRGALDACSPEERLAVLAHEQAHLDGHHDLHFVVVAFAAALDPALAALPRASRRAMERWADERAARETGDRRIVAAAIGRVAGADPPPWRLLTIALGATDVECRVRALLRHPPPRRIVPTLLLASVGMVAAGATLVAGHDTAQVFEAAMGHPVAFALAAR